MEYRVWYDEFELRVGDSLRQSIDKGLVNSRFGIVVLSPAFFAKNWPQYELSGLVAREMDGHKVILPIWHDVDREDVLAYSPTLADKVALSSRRLSIKRIAKALGEEFDSE
jgi:TIR domain